jgi:lysophospholipase L1-like esterase
MGGRGKSADPNPDTRRCDCATVRWLTPAISHAFWNLILGLSLAALGCGGGRGAEPVPARPASAPQVEATQSVRFVGRFDASDPAGPRFSWPGSSISAHFEGTGIEATLGDTGKSQFAVVVDGAPPTVLKTEGPVELTVSPAIFPRVDTCGYGIPGDGATCSFGPDTEDEYDAYGARAARLLGADHVTIAWSGRGMQQNPPSIQGDTMPALWERTLGDDPASRWDFRSYVPDVVVINLGTNDFWHGDPGVAFETTYEEFLARVRARYPHALVFCAIGPMLDPADDLVPARARITRLVAARNAKGDGAVFAIEFPPQNDADGFGCDKHPSELTHSRMAAQLAREIKRRAGW